MKSDRFQSSQTSFNPSHFPLPGSSNRTTASAVHTTARPLHSNPQDIPSDIDIDEIDGDGDRPHGKRHQRRKRREEDARKEGLVPLPIPIPDLRFEQGYLLSLAPFLHLDEPESSATAIESEKRRRASLDEDEKLHEERREERQEVEEHTAMVEDAASKPGEPSLYLNPNLRIEWGMVMYVTLRDQVRPLFSLLFFSKGRTHPPPVAT